MLDQPVKKRGHYRRVISHLDGPELPKKFLVVTFDLTSKSIDQEDAHSVYKRIPRVLLLVLFRHDMQQYLHDPLVVEKLNVRKN
jgi:hypothetical protein